MPDLKKGDREEVKSLMVFNIEDDGILQFEAGGHSCTLVNAEGANAGNVDAGQGKQVHKGWKCHVQSGYVKLE